LGNYGRRKFYREVIPHLRSKILNCFHSLLIFGVFGARSPTKEPSIVCICGGGWCAIYTSSSERNPGRKYFKCKKCEFFAWVDDVARMANKTDDCEELMSLRAEVVKLRAEVEVLKKEADKGKAAACALAKAIGKIVIDD
jgi:hypothetical protein